MTIHRSKIPYVQPFKNIGLTCKQILDTVIDLDDHLLGSGPHNIEATHTLNDLTSYLVVSTTGGYVNQIITKAPDIRVYGHVVVIENDKYIGLQRCKIVQPLKSLSCRHGAVAYDGNYLTIGYALLLISHCHSQSC